jgi:hypothetical protein
MKPTDVYLDLDGQEISLVHLDAPERKLLSRILRRARTHPDWDAFDNWWTVAIPAFYAARGLARKAVPRTIPWRVAQDQSSRMAVDAGLARVGDYRDELAELIHEKFASRRAFCEAAGLSEDMLSHVLAGRKDLSLEKLTRALSQIGYRLRIVPVPPLASRQKQTG